jgi:type VI protein secretion system component Hcp
MKNLAVLFLMCISGLSAFGQASQLSPNSIQIPQVSGTNSIANPANGMLIYNLSDHSLYFRKENEWVKINNTTNNVTGTPVIYYTTTSNPAIPGEITNGTHAGQTKVNYLDYDLTLNYDPATGGTGSGKAILSSINFSKSRGPNSIPFFKTLATGTHFDTMEFLFYDTNDVLYYSIKLSVVFINKIQKSELEGVDTIELKCVKIGWKDYTTNPAVIASFDAKMNIFSATY